MLDPSREHQTRHCQVDHCFGDFVSALVIATQTSVAAQPSECSLDDPSAWENDEFGCCVRTFDYLQNTSQGSKHPLDQFSDVTAIGPDVFDSSMDCQRFYQQLPGTIPILYVGWQHHDHQQQTNRVYQNVALDSIDLFSGVVAAIAAGFAALDRLAVDHPGRRLALSVVEQSDVISQMGVDLFDQSAVDPFAEVTIGGCPRRQVLGKVAPLATGSQQVEDCIEQFAVAVFARPARLGGPGKTI